MDITLVMYVSRDTASVAQLLAEIFEQSEPFNVELIAVDGGTMRVDFDKMNKHCSDHDIEFSTVRQDPMHRISPGFNVAAGQACGTTLAFVNPGIHIPRDFLKIVDYLGKHDKVLIPRAWMNVATHSGECWGFWAPLDNCSIIMPQRHYADDLLGEVVWESTAWPKTDAYFLASRLRKQQNIEVGMSVIGDYEYRRWTTSDKVLPYMPVVERNLVDVDDWVLSENDIRRYVVLGIPFADVTERVAQFQSVEELEKLIRTIVEKLRERHHKLVDPRKIAPAIQRDLDEILDRLFQERKLMLRPRFIVEPDLKNGNSLVRVRSAGDVLLPHEMAV